MTADGEDAEEFINEDLRNQNYHYDVSENNNFDRLIMNVASFNQRAIKA